MPSNIEFESSGKIAKINFSVPLPGSHLGRRMVRLDLDLKPGDWKPEASLGKSQAEVAGIEKTTSGGYSIDANKAQQFLRKKLRHIGYSVTDINQALGQLPELIGRPRGMVLAKVIEGGETTPPVRARRSLDEVSDLIHEFVNSAEIGVVSTPVPDSTGGGTTATGEIDKTPDPQLFLIEKVAISSSLGDYGMGRTVRTFTLLPGESTTIRIKTWQSTKESIKEASSIIDSHHEEAKERFENQVQKETTDKSTKAKEEKWSVEAEAKASWGWGSASVKGSASGAYQSSREQFAKQVSSAVNEHAKTASAKRELSVTSESETTRESGTETVIERSISNVNVRRVLNFVFRELNQEYTTRLHMTDILVAYTNGMEDTWREVPISGLRQLLSEVLVDGKLNEVARKILKFAAVVFDDDDRPQKVLQKISYNVPLDSFAVSEVDFDAEGLPSAPSDNEFYRFKRGSIGEQTDVDGVLLSTQTIVMRTDSVIVEALLGEADALDEFAMEVQQAAASEKTLLNAREKLLQDTLAAIVDPVNRAELAAKLFGPKAPPVA